MPMSDDNPHGSAAGDGGFPLGFIASPGLALLLMGLLAVYSAVATVVSTPGDARAFGSPVFVALLAATGWCLAAAMLAARPVRVHALFVHGGLLVIMTAALASWRLGVRGEIVLDEGARAGALTADDGTEVDFGFILELRDVVAGSEATGGASSELVIVSGGGRVRELSVRTNSPASFGGWRFYQEGRLPPGARRSPAGYITVSRTEASVLTAARDPGRLPALAGAVVLIAGLALRSLRRFRRDAGPPPPGAEGGGA